VSVTHGLTPSRPSTAQGTLNDPAGADQRDLRRIDHAVHALHALLAEIAESGHHVVDRQHGGGVVDGWDDQPFLAGFVVVPQI